MNRFRKFMDGLRLVLLHRRMVRNYEYARNLHGWPALQQVHMRLDTKLRKEFLEAEKAYADKWYPPGSAQGHGEAGGVGA